MADGTEEFAITMRGYDRAQVDQRMEAVRRQLAEARREVAEARNTADRVTAEAHENARRLIDEAQQRADALDGEVASKRTELLSALESERDNLTASVSQLRGFESEYRANLTSQIQNHLESLQNLSLAPQASGQTPRLDALMNNQG